MLCVYLYLEKTDTIRSDLGNSYLVFYLALDASVRQAKMGQLVILISPKRKARLSFMELVSVTQFKITFYFQ